ncbi:unnamed protein product [Didymodactylos carnosus]|uniref:VWFA domain-containing protein n=1 Tax=Didymodactylos carnosus TaxID=1234261 RepID=A0A8S2E5C3_9BILA|nr:unnamed protein product [Didymodactylos carnosus]CAF3836651.1 unnamed protein product [Didymodactylos carnosus]
MFKPYEMPLGGSQLVDDAQLGFSVSKDINSFRQNIRNKYLPIVTDLTYEGLFYDYFFDTSSSDNNQSVCKNLFCPTYSMATVYNNSFSEPNQQLCEYYMTVGFNSNLRTDTFKRNPLNLVVVIDVSGSMSTSFDRYYYDRPLVNNTENNDESRSKIQITLDVVLKILNHLSADDRLAIVTFNTNAEIIQTFKQLKDINIEILKQELLKIQANGGTDMSTDICTGASLFTPLLLTDDYDNRIVFLTDAQPNIGQLNEESFICSIEQLARQHIYMTFIGIGIDFNTKLISSITKQYGANYFSVGDSKSFIQLLDIDFDLIMTPLVFNLILKFESNQFEIDHVYGSPEYEQSTNELMKINTLFPSRRKNNGTRGGIVLIKLKKKNQSNLNFSDIRLTVTYEDRLNKIYEEKRSIDIISDQQQCSTSSYSNTGIRKGILLINYVTLLKQWIINERQHKFNYKPITIIFNYNDEHFLFPHTLSEWERQSSPLVVSDVYRQLFKRFIDYFQTEMSQLKDLDLKQETDLLKLLIEYEK